jgi:hypothetical protein
MLDTIALEYLVDRIYLGIHGYNQLKSSDFDDQNFPCKYSYVLKIILFALVALEKFSQTSESKHILFQSLTIKNEESKMNVLEYMNPGLHQIIVSNDKLVKRKKILKSYFFFLKVFMLNGYLIMYFYLIIVNHHMKQLIIDV